MQSLYDRYLGPRWKTEPTERSVWQVADRISAEELWRTHERRRERLVTFSRQRLMDQMSSRGASQRELEIADEVLDPEVLTIGFARRFATYKRATLILSDEERLAKLLNDPARPVQIIFAGKAHPKDEPGKALVKRIIELAGKEEFRHKLVFIENYNMSVARYLVQGTDVWLNTPLRPREASGTSGMKASANGVLNLSILDGWWDEAYTPEVGWAIGRRETYEDEAYQNRIEAEALFGLLEREVIPAFYNRGNDGLPRQWIEMMKSNIRELCPVFNTHRMVSEYTERFYLPSSEKYQRIAMDDYAGARMLVQWKEMVRRDWKEVKILDVRSEKVEEIRVGDSFEIQTRVSLGRLKPEDVRVDLFMGKLDTEGEIRDGRTTEMSAVEPDVEQEGVYLYQATAINCCNSGLHGYSIRVVPKNPNQTTAFLRGLITWA
jgi:starch phosphorylase